MTDYLVVGTAGHVDHGKTALVRALTGTDTDRLKEEKERGISITLGFAYLKTPARTFAFVDVPGHEKFVKTMAAGAWGVDVALLVVACDEGVMPQTREHLDILELLGVARLIVVFSKCDLADEPLRRRQREAIETELQGRPFACDTLFFSAKTGEGMETLLRKLEEVAARLPPRRRGRVFRLPVDRAFSLKGIGAVVTGTVRSGSVREGETLWLLPPRRKVAVRSVEQHGERKQRVGAGERVALHLAGVAKDELRRGQVICGEPVPVVTRDFLAKVRLLPGSPLEIRRGTRVHLHHHTAATTAVLRPWHPPVIRPGEEGIAWVRSDEPIAPVVGDRLLLRRISPVVTVGGGWVLDPAPPDRLAKDDQLARVSPGDVPAWLESKLAKSGFLPALEAAQLLGEETPTVEERARAAGLLAEGGVLVHPAFLETKRQQARSELEAFLQAHPLKPGMPKSQWQQRLSLPDRLVEMLLRESPELAEQGGVVRLKTFASPVSEAQRARMETIVRKVQAGGFQGIGLAELGGDDPQVREVVQWLKDQGEIVFGPSRIVYSARVIAEAKALLNGFFRREPLLTIHQAKALFGLSRRYTVALLEHLDQEGFTVRKGEGRVLRQKPPGR